MGLLCLSDPPVGLCSQRTEAACVLLTCVPSTWHMLSTWLLNESLTRSGPLSPSPEQYLRKKNEELEKLYQEQEVPKPKYW